MAKNKAKSQGSAYFTDGPFFYKPYRYTMAVLFILWFAYVAWTGYWGLVYHSFPVIDSGLQIAILWWLLDTCLTRTTYRLEENDILMVRRGVGHKQILRIPYKDIFGVHHFKNQLMKPMTYRYTFHEYSKLDNRPIWSLLYDIGSEKKVGRVLMKGSEGFWRAFEKKLPGRIRIPQEEVVTYAYQAFSEKLRAKGYFKKHPEMSFEEGIKQLRQKGTEMGGREDELTADDFKHLPDDNKQHDSSKESEKQEQSQ